MALVVEDGTGIVTANAFASRDEIDAILGQRRHTKWGTLVDEQAEEDLIAWASNILSLRTNWAGSKTHPTSGLAWPRTGVLDNEGNPIEDNVVPYQVKLACAFLVEHLIDFNPLATNTQNNVEMLKVEGITLKFDVDKRLRRWPISVSEVLGALGKFSTGTGPKRIIKH